MKKHKNNNMEHAAQVENVLVNEIDNQNGVHLYLEINGAPMNVPLIIWHS